MGEEHQPLGEDIAAPHIRHNEDVCLAGNGAFDALVTGGLLADGIVQREGAVDVLFVLQTGGHFGGIHRALNLGIYHLQRREHGNLGLLNAK